jgi:hypothetical protein
MPAAPAGGAAPLRLIHACPAGPGEAGAGWFAELRRRLPDLGDIFPAGLLAPGGPDPVLEAALRLPARAEALHEGLRRLEAMEERQSAGAGRVVLVLTGAEQAGPAEHRLLALLAGHPARAAEPVAVEREPAAAPPPVEAAPSGDLREDLCRTLLAGDLPRATALGGAADPCCLDAHTRRWLLVHWPRLLRAAGRGGAIAAWTRRWEVADPSEDEAATLALERLLVCHERGHWDGAGEDIRRLQDGSLDAAQSLQLRWMLLARKADEGAFVEESCEALADLRIEAGDVFGADLQLLLLQRLLRLAQRARRGALAASLADALLAAGWLAPALSLEALRLRRSRLLTLVRREEQAAALLAEDVAGRRRQGRRSEALDAALRLLALQRQLGRHAEGAALAEQVLPLCAQGPLTGLELALLLHAAAALQEVCRAGAARRCLALALPGLEQAGAAAPWGPWLSLESQALLQLAEEGGDWHALRDRARDWREAAATEDEALLAALVEARACRRTESAGGLRRAADFAPAARALSERSGRFLRVLVQLALLAGEEGDGETLALARRRLEACRSDDGAWEIALMEAEQARRAGDAAGCAREARSALRLGILSGRPALAAHLERRFAVMEPAPED